MLKEFEKRILSSLVLIPTSFFFIIQGSVYFIFFLSLIFLATTYEWLKMTKKNGLIKIFGIIFLFFSFYTAFNIREVSLNFFLLIIIVCIFTDIGGYFFGKIFKGPKLTSISPKKTYSGTFGGFLLSIISGLITIKYLNNEIFTDKTHFFILIFILFISFVSQIGDLIISYFKRKAKLKDTGKIIPGHGGLLDRIDGLIFVFPINFIAIFTFNLI